MTILIEQLERSHKKLRQLLLMSQECLLLSKDDKAELLIMAFSAYLQAHLEFEDCHMFPLFVSERAKTLRWQPLVYQKEHEKIVQLLELNLALFNSYLGFEGREKRLALLELLAKQNQFEHVLEHHEQREESDMFLQLKHLSEKELEGLAEHWQAIEKGCLKPYQQSIQAIAQELAA